MCLCIAHHNISQALIRTILNTNKHGYRPLAICTSRTYAIPTLSACFFEAGWQHISCQYEQWSDAWEYEKWLYSFKDSV